MAKVENLNKAITEEEKIVWILITRNKATKQIVRRVCKDGDATQDALAKAKEDGESFITLTTEARVRSFLNGTPVKAWASNYAALIRRGVEVNYNLFKCILDWLDCTEENDRWTDVLTKAPENFKEILDVETMADANI